MKYLFVLIATLCFYLESSQASSNLHESIRAVPIKENGEELIDLRNQTIIRYRRASLIQNPTATQIRKTVYQMLCNAQELLPNQWRFEVSVGLRSLEIQKTLFDDMYAKIKQNLPDLSEKELFMETSKFVAPLRTWDGVLNVPPHSTGGAIDLVLVDLQGEYIEMGIDMEKNLNHPLNEKIIETDSPLISLEARKNRYIMGKALSAVGFVNYPAEFWHWSYGDRRWAFVNNEAYSIYGPLSL